MTSKTRQTSTTDREATYAPTSDAPTEDVAVADAVKGGPAKVDLTALSLKQDRTRGSKLDPTILADLRSSYESGEAVGYTVESFDVDNDTKKVASILRAHAYDLGYGVKIRFHNDGQIVSIVCRDKIVKARKDTTA